MYRTPPNRSTLKTPYDNRVHETLKFIRMTVYLYGDGITVTPADYARILRVGSACLRGM